jgi:hypothetical protein
MEYTEHDYIEMGYQYAKAKNEYERLVRARIIKEMLSKERAGDLERARFLVERGRLEA